MKSVGKASFVIHNSFAIAVLGLINRREGERRREKGLRERKGVERREKKRRGKEGG